MPSTDAVNRGYWDPEESTRTKWTTTYAAELDARNLTHDFTGLSELLLGQAQPKQFQSYDDEQPTGWHWGSEIKADGSFEPLVNPENTDRNNANAQIPRSYNIDDSAGHGNLYNWFSATAESGNYTKITASDSICAKGWKLPEYTNASVVDPSSKSFDNLISAYSLIADSHESATLVTKLPLGFQFDGNISLSGGGHNVFGTNGFFWSSVSSGSSGKQVRGMQYNRTTLSLNNSIFKAHGYSMRCVKE